MMATLEDIIGEEYTKKDLAKALELTKSQLKRFLKDLEYAGYVINEYQRDNKSYIVILNKPYKKECEVNADVIAFVSDTHLGSKYAREDLLSLAYKMIKNEGIKVIFHGGDLLDGMNVYRGQLADLKVIGLDNQINYLTEVYPKERGIKTYFITGNHDEKLGKEYGFEIGNLIEQRRSDLIYLGRYNARVRLNDEKILELVHGAGGGSYALSYKSQVYLRNLPPSDLPDILAIGHYHTSFYAHYKGVEVFNLGCFIGATDFSKRRGLSSDIGFWIVDISEFKGNSKKIKLQWISLV